MHYSNVPINDTWMDRIAFANIRELFGGQLRFMVVGGAVSCPEVTRFFKATTGALVCTMINVVIINDS